MCAQALFPLALAACDSVRKAGKLNRTAVIPFGSAATLGAGGDNNGCWSSRWQIYLHQPADILPKTRLLLFDELRHRV